MPINGAGNLTDSDRAAIESQLNEIYRPAVAAFTVEPLRPLQLDWFATEAQNTLDSTNSAFYADYNAQMQRINQEINRLPGYDPEKYYLIVVQSAQGGIKGFMPRARNKGFIVAAGHGSLSDLGRTMAHELGHGAFRLRHPWEQFSGLVPGQTDNLMDYASGTRLHHYQWHIVHNPPPLAGLLDGDEEGELAESLKEYFPNFSPSPCNGRFNVPNTLTAQEKRDAPLFPTEFNVYAKFDQQQLSQIKTFIFKCTPDPVLEAVIKNDDNKYSISKSYRTEELPAGTSIPDFPQVTHQIPSDSRVSLSFVDWDFVFSPDSQVPNRLVYNQRTGNTITVYTVPADYKIVPTTKECDITQKVVVAHENQPLRLRDCLTSPQEPQFSICAEINSSGTFSPEELNLAVAALNASKSLRAQSLGNYRPKNSYYHLVASGTYGNAVLLSESEKQYIEENLYLLKVKTGWDFYVLFHKTTTQYSASQLSLFANQVFQQCGFNPQSSTLIIINYESFNIGLAPQSCGTVAIRPNADNDLSLGGNKVSTLILKEFAKIPKPLYISKLLLLADNSIEEINFKPKRPPHSEEEVLVTGHPFINMLTIYKSRDYDDIQNKLAEKPSLSGHDDSAWDKYRTDVDKWRRELDALLAAATVAEQSALQDFNSNYWIALKNDEVKLRHSFIEDRNRVLQYAAYHYDERISSFIASAEYLSGAYQFSNDILYSDITWWSVIDPVITEVIDIGGLIPALGDFFDIAGAFYATIRGNYYDAAGYAAAVFIGAGAYYHNAGNAARYYVMGRYGDDQMEFLIRESLDNIDPREMHRFSIFGGSRTEAEQILGQIISENSHRIMTDQIYDAAGSVIRQGVAGDIVAARQIVEEIAAFAPRLGAQSAQYIRPQFVSYLNSISDDVLRRKILTQIDELVPTGGLTNLLDDLADPAFRQALEGVDFAWVRAWGRLKDSPLKSNTYWLGRVNRWEEANLGLSYDYDLTYNTVLVSQGSRQVAELYENLFIHKYSGFGLDVRCPLDRTTTIIGLLGIDDPSRLTGTRSFFDVGIYKGNLPPNNNPGGINILHIETGWSLSVNMQWLQNAMNRGDIIRIISDPYHPRTIWENGIPPGQSGHNGVKTVTGKEIDYLINGGYFYDPSIPGYRN